MSDSIQNYRARALKLAKLAAIPEEERARFAYRGLRLELKPLELNLLRELTQGGASAEGWRGQCLDTLALTLMWTDLAAQPPEDDEAHREALAAITERVRTLRSTIGDDVEGATPETFDLFELCEKRLARVADGIVSAKLARVSKMENATGPLDSIATATATLPVSGKLMSRASPAQGPGTGTRTLARRTKPDLAEKASAPATQTPSKSSNEPATLPKKAKKRRREPSAARTMRNRIAAGAVVYAGMVLWAGQGVWELRQTDVSIVREISGQTVVASLPSARVIEADEDTAMARIEVGPEWQDWNEDLRLERALQAVQSVSAKGYRRVDLVQSGAIVARWNGGVVDLL